MPKSKKETGSKESAANQTAAKTPIKAAAKKKSPPATATGGHSLIDTSLAAENAARQLVAGINPRGAAPAGKSGKPESAMFKQMKSGLNKPSSTAMNNLLDKTHGPSATKSHGFSKQVGHNQTVGSDAARMNVPRRTAG